MAVGLARRALVAIACTLALAACAPQKPGQPPASRDCEKGACPGFLPVVRARLDDEIDTKAEALRKGPLGSRAAELASLRLAATGAQLVDAGSPRGAREALEEALELWDRNGYARLFLAQLDAAGGQPEKAATLAADSRRDLPGDRAVRDEVDRFLRSLQHGRAGSAQ